MSALGRISALASTALVVSLLFAPAPTLACSQAAPADLSELIATGTATDLEDRPIVGVFEQRHIARTPMLLIRGPRSASIVDRYWGEEPDLAVRLHGSSVPLFFQECGNSAAPLGHVSIGLILDGSRTESRSGFHTTLGGLTIDEGRAGLTARFGEPTVVTTGPDDYVMAYALLLWQPLAVYGGLIALVVGVARWTRTGGRPDFIPVTAVAGLVGALVAAFAMGNPPGWTARLLALFGVGAAVVVGRVLAPALAAAAAVVAAGGLYLHWHDAFDTGDTSMQVGLVAAVLATGALAWRTAPWATWLAVLTIGLGALMFTANWLWAHDYVTILLILTVSAVVGVIVGGAAWWLAIRREPPTVDAPPDTIGM